jgi:hypothetical protein
MPAFTLNPLRKPFMRANRLIPIAVLAFAVACTENSSNPTENSANPVDIPLSSVSVHFLSKTTGATGPSAITAQGTGGQVTVNFKIAGLGDNVTIQVTATADATAEYACQNNGGNFPSDPKKQQVSGPVSATGSFTSGKNGSVTGSLTLSPPASTLNCPGGQHEVLLSVSYTNVSVSAPGAGSFAISGTFSAVGPIQPD